MKNKIIFSSDGDSSELVVKLIEHACSLGFDVEVVEITGNFSLDYVDVAKQLVAKLSDTNFIGVVVCENAQGVAMAANKFSRMRAALCHIPESARIARSNFDANILCLDSLTSSIEEVVECFDVFINTPFEVAIHEKRVSKLGVHATPHLIDMVNLIVRAVIIYKDHVLLSTTTEINKEFALNLYFLPGGHVDYKESAISALKRELMEEINLVVDLAEFIGVLECTWNKKEKIYHELNLVYKVQAGGLSLETPPESSEPFIKFVWCPISKLSDYKILPEKLAPIIQEAAHCQSKLNFYSQMV